MIFCSLVMAVFSRTPRPGAAHPDHSAPGLGSCLSLTTPSVRLSPNYFTRSMGEPDPCQQLQPGCINRPDRRLHPTSTSERQISSCNVGAIHRRHSAYFRDIRWDISDHPTLPICPLWRSEEAYRAVHQPL